MWGVFFVPRGALWQAASDERVNGYRMKTSVFLTGLYRKSCRCHHLLYLTPTNTGAWLLGGLSTTSESLIHFLSKCFSSVFTEHRSCEPHCACSRRRPKFWKLIKTLPTSLLAFSEIPAHKDVEWFKAYCNSNFVYTWISALILCAANNETTKTCLRLSVSAFLNI